MLKSDSTVKCLRCGKERKLGVCKNCGHNEWKEERMITSPHLSLGQWTCNRCKEPFYESGHSKWKCECGTSNEIKLTRTNKECFIATAAYGSASAKSVIILREFRDTSLRNSLLGKSFIKFYEKYSPPIALIIGKRSFLRFITRKIIVDPAAWLVEKIKS